MGCAGKGFYVTVTRPAEINLKEFDTIAVADIKHKDFIGDLIQILTGWDTGDILAKNFSGKLTRALREKSKRFEVLDQKSLKTWIGEGDSSAGIALISGEIYEDYDEDVTHKDIKKKNKKTGEVETVRWYYREGTARVRVSLSIVDSRTLKVLAYREFDESESEIKTREKKKPPSIIEDRLLETCRKQIIRSVLRVVLPYSQRVYVSFETDEDLPELQRGFKIAKSGNWKSSLEIFERITKNHPNSPVIHKAYYNLGLGYMYTDQFNQARTAFEEAYERKPRKRYRKALAKLNIRIEDKRRLKEQGVANY